MAVDVPAPLVSPDITGRVIPEDTWGILCVYAEARGEPYEGQIAVANVVRNRTERRWFSDGTIVGTVTRAKQFSWLNSDDGQRTRVFRVERGDPAWLMATRAWFESEHVKLVEDAVLYHALTVEPYWAAHVRFISRIGAHIFYAEDK